MDIKFWATVIFFFWFVSAMILGCLSITAIKNNRLKLFCVFDLTATLLTIGVLLTYYLIIII